MGARIRTGKLTPVIKSASSLARYDTAFATSRGVHIRPAGMTDAKAFCLSLSDKKLLVLYFISIYFLIQVDVVQPLTCS